MQKSVSYPYISLYFSRELLLVAVHGWFAIKTDLNTKKRKVLEMYESCPGQQNLQSLRAAQGLVQNVASICAIDYWLDLCASIQLAEDIGNITVMNDGIKKAHGPTQKKSVSIALVSHWRDYTRSSRTDGPLGRTLLRTRLQREHRHRLGPNISVFECLPMMQELDAESTIGKLKKALNCLSSGKAKGTMASHGHQRLGNSAQDPYSQNSK